MGDPADTARPHNHQTPKLGDFSRLELASSASSSPPSSPRLGKLPPTNHDETRPVTLGNFSKIFSLIGSPHPPISSIKSTFGPTSRPNNKVVAVHSSTENSLATTVKEPLLRPSPSPLARELLTGRCADVIPQANRDTETEPVSESASESDSPSTPATSLSSSPNKLASFLKIAKKEAQVGKSSRVPFHSSLPREQRHEVILEKLKPHCIVDRLTGKMQSDVAANGVYVFLDTSNIHISFVNALKDRFGLDRNARLTPVPVLDIEFLTEILVRDRLVKIKNAGCSYRPDRPEPPVIKDLRRCGYSVDVRERKRLEEPHNILARERGHTGRRKSTQLNSASLDKVHSHYIEDLVDETLQTRIGEAVMEHFSTPGTLVLATGDGKAAKFSDGFFTYADRALRMGWNVEVVSWNLSLSSAWLDPDWVAQWGSRFRVTRLDEFLLELCASHF